MAQVLVMDTDLRPCRRMPGTAKVLVSTFLVERLSVIHPPFYRILSVIPSR